MRKLRSIAFQPCISWGGQYFWNGSNKWFRPNFRPENTNFGGHFSWSPDFGGLWDLKTWNFVSFDIIPKKYWLKREKWAMSSYGDVKNVRFDVIILFFADGHPKTQKNVFFCISHNYSTFWCRRPYMGSTMRKLTSWRFQKCVTYWGSEFLNGSYGSSKSTESAIFDSSPKISGVTKKEICHNNENLVSKRIAPQDNPIGSSFYSFRASIPVIFALLFFCDADFFFEISPDFDSQ